MAQSDTSDSEDERRPPHRPPPPPPRPSQTTTVAGLFVYPIKGCKGTAVDCATLGLTGFEYDRCWMVVSAEKQQFMSQRQHPTMCLIEPTLDLTRQELCIRAPEMPELRISIGPDARPQQQVTKATVWRDTVEVYDAGDKAAAWFTTFLKTPARLVSKGDSARRLNPKYCPPLDVFDHEPQSAFSDAWPFLILSEGSLSDLNERMSDGKRADARNFRPNIVVRGCAPFEEDTWTLVDIGGQRLHIVSRCTRCTVTRVDPDSALPNMKTLPTLMSYRRVDSGDWSSPCFGVNACHEALNGVIRVGDAVRVLQTGELRL